MDVKEKSFSVSLIVKGQSAQTCFLMVTHTGRSQNSILYLHVQIQHAFDINEPGGLALSTDIWRLPLSSSTAVLRDNDILQVSRSSGPEPSLQVRTTITWSPSDMKRPCVMQVKWTTLAAKLSAAQPMKSPGNMRW